MKTIPTLIASVLLFAGCASLRGGDPTQIGNVPQTLPSWGNGAPPLILDVPASWAYRNTEGPDFDIHRIAPPDGEGSIGIYVGHNPQEIDTDPPSTHSIIIGGKAVQFFTRPLEDSETMSEAILSDFFSGETGSGVSGLKLHIMVYEGRTGFADEAFRCLQTLRKGARPTTP